jgi:Ni/Co efflux regulator RcnB
MKKIALAVLAVLLMLSGVTLAQQSGEEKRGSSMKDRMQEMMKQKQSGEGHMEGMGGMMGMMKMMEQCSDMMKSAHHQGEKAKESQNK